MDDVMSDAMAGLVAKEAITESLHRYCVAVDRIDEATWWHVWHHDAIAHYEEIFDGSAASLMAWIFETHRSCDATSHQLSNVLIDVVGQTAYERELRHRLHTCRGHRRRGSRPIF